MKNKLFLLIAVMINLAVGFNPTDWKVTPYTAGTPFVEINENDNFIVGGGARYEVNREGQKINGKQLIGSPRYFAKDSEGNEWFGTDKGLIKVTVTGEEKVYPYGENTVFHWNIQSLKIKGNCIYVGSGLYGDGETGGLTVINSLDDPENLTEANYKTYLTGSVVKSIELYNDEIWCIASKTVGHSLWKVVNGVATEYDDPSFLYNPRFVRVDANGVVWVMNSYNGISDETWLSRFGTTWIKKIWDDKHINACDINDDGIFLVSSSTKIAKIDVNKPVIEIAYEPRSGDEFCGIFVSYKGNFLITGKKSIMEEKAGSPIISFNSAKVFKSVIIRSNYIEVLKPGNFNISLFSVKGQKIWNQTIKESGKILFSSSSSVNNIPSGTYIINIISEGEKISSRFVITK